ncbi:glycosyltransferase family 4 protein [Cyanobium gracile]|uniref:Glycosyltransferase family 4 protein n=1 Tax=Cyanobium gracile UHCC 0281 TaxID=3110309 RepID=A0ABU5SZ97_9CYAN|nr:glycosyltransferase family 4 protein [Cyanobium gracile]MEA5443733.1 glycosyltransferase family 4 protein [Cyanobium gracile UHCC 0281]
MKVLHVLATGGTGKICGIRPSLEMLACSPLGERHRFAMVASEEVNSTLADWNPDLLIWHKACSWKGLPSLIRHRARRQILFEHHYCAGFERHNVPSTLRFRTMLRLSYAAMEQVVAVSRAQRSWLQTAHLISASRSRVLLSSRTVDDFLVLPSPPPAEGRPLTLLAYGRLTTQKGFDRLLRALRLLPDGGLRLLLVGEGPQKGELEALASADPRVELLGARKDIPALLGQVDAVVIPSRWEPWGNVCLEARAAGRPVIVSDVDGLPEQVLDSADGSASSQVGSCGLVVKGESDADLAAALEALLSSTDQQRSAWSAAGRYSARSAWSDYMDAWSHLLDEFS